MVWDRVGDDGYRRRRCKTKGEDRHQRRRQLRSEEGLAMDEGRLRTAHKSVRTMSATTDHEATDTLGEDT